MAWINDLTDEELRKSPGIIQHLFAMAWSKIPISTKRYQEAKEKHPEYFTMDPDRKERYKKGSALASPQYQ